MSAYRFVTAVSLACALPAAALGQASSRPSYLDVALTYYVAGQTVGVSHEVGHMGAALLTGGRVHGWVIRPFHQAVHVTTDRRWKRAAVSLAGPVTSRLLHELPRWIHEPTRDGRYYRFAAGYAFYARLQMLVNTPLFHFWHARDVADFSRAVTDDRTGRIAIATALTLVGIADVALQWDELETEYRILTGRTPFPTAGGAAALVAEPPLRVTLVTIPF